MRYFNNGTCDSQQHSRRASLLPRCKLPFDPTRLALFQLRSAPVSVEDRDVRCALKDLVTPATVAPFRGVGIEFEVDNRERQGVVQLAQKCSLAQVEQDTRRVSKVPPSACSMASRQSVQTSAITSVTWSETSPTMRRVS